MKHLPKINSIHFGGALIAAGLIVGIVIPAALWLFLHKILWFLVIAGGLILLAFLIIFMVEMHQDNGKVPHYQKNLRTEIPLDPETQYAVIRSSICTGEKVAGFKNKTDGHFVDVMLIRSPDDEYRFKEMYGLDKVKVEY